MRAKYSPTVSERYLDSYWWHKNGGGHGLLPDGSTMSATYHRFDHEGYNAFGYDKHGRDRAGFTAHDYECSPELYNETAERSKISARYGKTVSDYWPQVERATQILLSRFPGMEVFDPQDGDGSGIRRFVDKRGIYGVKADFGTEAGNPRSLTIRFDDGAGGSGPRDDSWTVTIITRLGEQTSRRALCMVDTADMLFPEIESAVVSFDPNDCLFEIKLVECGDGSFNLEVLEKGEPSDWGDTLAIVAAEDRLSALERFADGTRPGGPLSRLAARRISAELARLPAPEVRHGRANEMAL